MAKSTTIKVTTPDNKVFGAMAGHELIVGKAGLSYTHVLNEEPVGRRRLKPLDLGAMSNAIASEISLVSLLQNTDILTMLNRSEVTEDKALIFKISKMAVSLQIVTPGHGNYSIQGN